MTTLLKNLASGQFQSDFDELNESKVKALRFYRKDNRMEIDLESEYVLSFEAYSYLHYAFEQATKTNISIRVFVKDHSIQYATLQKYLSLFNRLHREYSLCDHAFTYDEDNHKITYLLNNDDEIAQLSTDISPIEEFLHQIGCTQMEVVCLTNNVSMPDVQEVVMNIIPENPVPSTPPQEKKRTYYRKKPQDYQYVELKNVLEPIDDIQFSGEIFAVDETITRNDKMIQVLSIFDGTDAMNIKRFEGKYHNREELQEIKSGDYVHFYGKCEYDSFTKDLVLMPSNLEKEEKKVMKDTGDEHRIEFHMHSYMSEMDGVCNINDIINYVWNSGLAGVVITDHADVQSFVKAYNTATSLKKKDPDREFHVGFGCEMNMVDDRLMIVRNPNETRIDDAEYISFDLETTGLSAYYDSIIEFGAVKMKNQTVVDRKQMFIKPPFPIPAFITNKTNITNNMVANAKSFAECYQEIIDWIGDGILVAHNATFDFHFINEELRRIGQPPLKNTVIDTLDLSRAVLRQRRAYRLGNISRYYHVPYDEEVAHRADYDAEALSGIFVCLLKDAKEKYNVNTLHDLQVLTQDDEIFKKVRRSHVCVIAKNQDGMRDLYHLVTKSNTQTLAVMGKANSKEGTDVAAEARVTRGELQKHRQNLLIGSACLNGELFELACNGDDVRLETAMKFYDYVELQPLGNYSTEIVRGAIPNVDRLKDVQRRIIQCARKLHIPVIADSDAHYCSPDQKMFRDVYIMSQGVGGATHPLYIRDESLRHRTKNPNQHIRFTQEMKDEFAWLEDDAYVHEIVIDNPKKLFGLIDESMRPVPSGTFPPHITSSDSKLRHICEKTAKQMYEFEGKVPEIVTERLDYELDNIIRNGYDVHYYIAHLLVKKSNKDGYVVGSRGSVGSSFTATMSGITEVNPLKPHYLCPHCRYSIWIDDPEIKSGFDLEDKPCPKCGTTMTGNGQNIPFQTFLGFNADKVPDIDLNFSNEYQWRAHDFIKEVFGSDHAFRAGTIGTVAEKTAFGYVQGYCEKMGIDNMRKPMKEYLAMHTQNVKRTTGQHPGGIIIIPDEYVAEDFTPVQFPANDPSAAWMTTHYDFHDIHDNVLKFDILGHVDPTAMRLLQNIADKKPMTLPMNDPETLSLFYEDKALKANPKIYKKETGALGLPEFGTATTRKVLEETRPHHFSELVMISGLSHGTDVWAGNAQSLVQAGHPLAETIACRDDIMTYLLEKNLEPLDAFKIMEDVRKGKGLREDQETKMREHNVPEWYIESCKKIKYMFPKAHAVAYVMMAVRIAWYKVHEPLHFYIQYFTLRCDAYEIETMCKGIEAIRERLQDIAIRRNDRNAENPVTNKEKALYDTLEVCEELYARGYGIGNVDLYKSRATEFVIDPDDEKVIIPPFVVIDGLGANVARSIETAREEAPFLSKEDLGRRTQVSATLIKKLTSMGVLQDLQESNQMSLF